jgi:hypothetical protein
MKQTKDKLLRTKIEFYFIIGEIINHKDDAVWLGKLHDEYKEGLFEIV